MGAESLKKYIALALFLIVNIVCNCTLVKKITQFKTIDKV